MTSSQFAALVMPVVGTACIAVTAVMVKMLFVQSPKAKAKAEKLTNIQATEHNDLILPIITLGSPEAKIAQAISTLGWLGPGHVTIELDTASPQHEPEIRSIKRSKAS